MFTFFERSAGSSISTNQAAIILRLWELARDIDCEGRH
jgi:hypothetical protein